MRRLKATIGLVAIGLMAGLLPVAGVSADELIPSALTLTGVGDVEVGQAVTLTAAVTEPADGYDVDATITFSGNGPSCDAVAVSTSGTTCDLGTLPEGTYTYEATYSGNTTVAGSTSNQVTFDVTAVPPPPPPDPEPSSVTLAGPGSIVVGDVATLTATVTAPAGYEADGATIDFTSVPSGGPDCLDVPVSTSGTTCDLSGLAVGSYTYVAAYSGNAAVAGSTSDPATFVVTAVPDVTLDASGVTRDYSTFYPVKDGYRDRVTMSGMRNEPITVTIRVYSPSGHRVKLVVLPLAGGAYSYQWSGRDSAGRILGSGRYKIVQTLRDAAGNSQAVTLYSTLSKKRLITRTKYVTKLGRSITAATAPVLVHKTIGYVKLDARSVDVAVGYQFTIPSATRYTSISFQVYGRGPRSAPVNQIAMQDFDVCPYTSGDWNLGCFDHAKAFGSTANTWFTTTGSTSANRSGTRVRGAVVVNHGVAYVYKVRVKVVYQVLG